MVKQLTNEQIGAIEEAIKEGKIQAKDLIAEISPLIEDYFICETHCEENEMAISFPNGQKFLLEIKEQQ